MKLFLAGFFGLVISGALPLCAQAAPPANTQLSILVTGKISVSSEGTVTDYSLEDTEALPPSVVKLLETSIPKWRFITAERNGEPAVVDARMSVRVTAKPDGDNSYSAQLGTPWVANDHASEVIRKKPQKPPRYPIGALRQGVSGTVFFVVQVDKSGHVRKVGVQQVNLGHEGSPKDMKRWRQLLAEGTIDAVREWTYEVPTSGPLASLDHWNVRSFISYDIGPIHGAKHGWTAYVPGPPQDIPWLKDNTAHANNVDALPDNGAYLVGAGPRLIYKPQG